MPNNPRAVDNLKPIKKGEVRNPNGRPKGVPNTATRLKKFLEIVQNVENPVTGEIEALSIAEQMDLVQLAKALKKGELPSYKELLDRSEGKSKETIDVTHSGEVQFTNNVPRPSKNS